MYEKTAIITSCSKKKLNHPEVAKKLYQGQFFQGVAKLSDRMETDFWVLSAKHGLVSSHEKLEPYDFRINTKEQIEKLQKVSEHKFMKILNDYDRIVFFMGKKYLSVFDQFLSNDKIIIATDHRGSGGYLQLISCLLRLSTKNVENLFQSNKKYISVEDLNKNGVLNCHS